MHAFEPVVYLKDINTPAAARRDSRVAGVSATTRRIQDVMATDEMETDMARRDSEEDKQHGADGAQADTDPSVSTTENESGRTPRLGLRAPAKMATEEV